jgi:hypothetical protein
MRAVALLAIFVVLAGVFCGGNTDSQAPVASAKWPAEACGVLTDDEVVSFVKVLPTLSAALMAGNWSPTVPEKADGPVATLAPFVEGMNVPGVEESLKTAGTDWGTVKMTLLKVFAASAALSVDGAPPEMIEQMKKDTSAAAKRGFKDFESVKAACAQIPEANKQVVANHQQELQALQTLGR